MERLKCEYCNKTYVKPFLLARHEIGCCGHKNHISRKSNQDFPNLLTSELRRLSKHYAYLYPNEYQIFYKSLLMEYKNLGYKHIDAIAMTKLDLLSYLIELDDPIQEKSGTWKCPLCGLRIIDMGAHVDKIHHLDWGNFCSEYNWKDCKVFFSQEYRNSLSKNKLHFYNNTEAGANLKHIQSVKISGKSNPACSDDVKLKISKSRKGKKMSTSNKAKISSSTCGGLYSDKYCSFGYTFWSIHDGKEVRYRSKIEYAISLMLDYYQLSYEFEPYKIEYSDPDVEYPRNYMVDFIVNGRLFEVKSCEEEFSCDQKYTLVNQQLNRLGKKLEILTMENLYDIFDIRNMPRKPLSYFYNLIIENLALGNCKLKLPVTHDKDFYLESSFLQGLLNFGDSVESVLQKGMSIYEDKKNKCNN